MKKFVVGMLAVSAMASASFAANLASDNGSNYGGGWTNNSNGGTGFGAWSISSSGGAGGFAGTFIGDPATAGISGMSTQSFGLFANPAVGAFVNADRDLTGGGLSVGQTFQFQWGVNWDSDGVGNKGFNLYVGGVGGTQVVNVNMGGSSVITFNGDDVGFGYGVNAMLWQFTMTAPNTLNITANDRDGSGTFTTNITVSAGLDAFRLYASDLAAGDQRQPYFNNFEVVPEPSTVALAVLGVAALVVRRMRKA